MVTTQPVGLELAQEQLLSERQEHTALPERRSLEGMVPKLERHSSAFSEHRLEHKAPEQHSSVSRYSNWQPERHTMASSSTDQASAY